jgi:hypothetical protein
VNLAHRNPTLGARIECQVFESVRDLRATFHPSGRPGEEFRPATPPAGEVNATYKVTLFPRGTEDFAPDKSILYAVASRGEVAIHRQPWRDGKLAGPDQVALKIPFAFTLAYGGNGYDFSRDLSTIIYARPGGQADLYLVSQR